MLSINFGRRNTQMTMKPIINPMGLFSNPSKEKGSRICKDQKNDHIDCSMHGTPKMMRLHVHYRNRLMTCLIIVLLT